MSLFSRPCSRDVLDRVGLVDFRVLAVRSMAWDSRPCHKPRRVAVGRRGRQGHLGPGHCVKSQRPQILKPHPETGPETRGPVPQRRLLERS